ncbi:MAG: Elongation factor Ts [Acidimicrobiales bacterium]|nr:MAG: translation elongation factor Ts [Actinomycetota bacterium]MBV6509184.1 Elongation factor Ts [Acidimicrobiales bacterium]RIK08471.1 MAG: translation elongation factor Ts [Acidobacteriota bacterium]
MAEISARDVKALRDRTGAGMMDCKRALVEADGDPERAAQLLREWGLIKADDRGDRANPEGAVALAVGDRTAAIAELKAETDFSAKSEDFVSCVRAIAEAVLDDGEQAAEQFSDRIDQLKVTKKENIELGRIVRFESDKGDVLDTYLHVQDGRGTNAVMVELAGGSQELAHEVALHIAFAKPVALTREEIPSGEVEKARASFEGLTRAEGKPEQAIPKIVEGRMNAWYKERVLPEQGLFGEKETVQQRLGEAKIVRFAQVYIGE